MKKAPFILFVLVGLITASLLLFMILVSGIFGFALSGKIIYLFEMLLGICGYLGFLSLIRGLKEQYYKLNLILLGLGFFGFNIFLFLDEEMISVGKRIVNGIGNLVELILYFLPNIACLTFIILIVSKMYEEKTKIKKTLSFLKTSFIFKITAACVILALQLYQ